MVRDIFFDDGILFKRKNWRGGKSGRVKTGHTRTKHTSAGNRKKKVEQRIHRFSQCRHEYVCLCASRVSTYTEVIQLNTIVAFNL